MAGSSAGDLLAAARGGDRAALARLLSVVERGDARAREVSRELSGGPQAPPSYTLGLTGAPGAGKSTLTNALLRVLRAEGLQVAVLAVDPSSPFSGGALLGDRLRMADHALDEGVFVRSMATRGHVGGLAVATPEAARVLAAAGYGWVLVETVGVGQVEVEVAGQADTTVVVVTPGWGDAVQAAKAGLMEIADVFVVNKADRPGATETVRDIERTLDLGGSDGGWRPPVVEAVASAGRGAEDLWAAVSDHRRHLESGGELSARRRRRAEDEISRMVSARLAERAREVAGGAAAGELAAGVARGEIDPWTAADRLLDQ